MNIKPVLAFCLLLAGIIALPVQSQAPTATPLANPGAEYLAACGLPTKWSTFSSGTHTFNLTADCILDTTPGYGVGPLGVGTGNYPGNGFYIVILGAATVTINGNGHSITVTASNFAQAVTTNAILNLNDVVITRTGRPGSAMFHAALGGRINLNNVALENNQALNLLSGGNGGLITATDLYVGNNRFRQGDVRLGAGYTRFLANARIGTINITNSIFRRNTDFEVILSISNGGSLTLSGCAAFFGNRQPNGSASLEVNNSSSTFTDNRTGSCQGSNFPYWLALTPPPQKPKTTATPWPSPTPRPPESYQQEYTELQEETGITITTAHGLGSGVHFRQLDGAGIGVQALIDAGPLAAIDVYGYVEQGVEICFPHVGRVIFLDAAASPRAMMPLEAWQDDGATCVSIDRPGSLVLLPPA